MATNRLIHRWKRAYGPHRLHLPVLLAAFALAGYSVWVLGFDALWNRRVWWQAIAVWFAAAIIAHDFILFPAYALLDRVLAAASARTRLRVSPLNYIRVPLLGIGLSFLLFFPGIIRQGAATFHAATGGTQQPFLVRWLLLSATMFALSAFAYAIQSLRARRRH
ncbi:hypothetical protein ACFYXQ_32160 [Nocardia jiangxiensis]|uniref:Lipoprotein n=1 Tax=Nocardia jiangxiensis TaxID=282685 RepID=A0ABW6S819_9NOCA